MTIRKRQTIQLLSLFLLVSLFCLALSTVFTAHAVSYEKTFEVTKTGTWKPDSDISVSNDAEDLSISWNGVLSSAKKVFKVVSGHDDTLTFLRV